MRIDKGINISKISDNTQRLTERTFLKQKPDVFVKSSSVALNNDLKSKIDKTLKASIATLGLGTGLNYIKNLGNKNNLDIDDYLNNMYDEEHQKELNTLKSEGFDDETIEKIYTCKEKCKFNLTDDNIKVLASINKEEPEFFREMITKDDLEISYKEPSIFTSFLTGYSAKFGNDFLSIYTRNDGLLINKIKIKTSEDKTVSTENSMIILDTNNYKKTTSVKKDKTPYVKTEETGVVSNNVGLMHKYKKEFYFDENNNVVKTFKEDLDGTKTFTSYKYNDKGQPSEEIKRVYSRENVIDSKTTTKFTYEEFKESEFMPPKFIPIKNIESIDYKNNTVTKTLSKGEFNEFISQEKIIKNPKTGKLKKEIIEKSEIDGVLNSKIIDESGKEKIESIGKKDKDGNINIEKHIISLDGTKTDYKLNKSENDFELSYKITDKEGKPLTTVDRTYKRISPERTFSSLNGHGYAMTSSDTGITIKDLVSNEVKEFKYEDLISSAEDDEKAIEFVKNLPADLILNLTDKNLKFDFTEDKLSSVYMTGMSIVTGDDLFIFAHESGHSKDYQISQKAESIEEVINAPSEKVIATNKEFRKIFEEEKTSVIKNLSPAELKHISYFIEEIECQGGINYSPAEVVAETNALFSGGISPNEISIRGHYLQKYFPKTIAYLSKIINPNSNISLS